MGWQRQMATTEDLLDRIVVLLLAIADLAERAAGASQARRCLVLAILRSGEATTRDFVRAPDAADWSRTPAAAVAGSDPEDVMALARMLRALALLVQGLSARRRHLAATGDIGHANSNAAHCGRSAFVSRIPATALPPAPLFDTS